MPDDRLQDNTLVRGRGRSWIRVILGVGLLALALPAGVWHLAHLAGGTGVTALCAMVPVLAAVWALALLRQDHSVQPAGRLARGVSLAILLICAAILWYWPVDEANRHVAFHPDLLLLTPLVVALLLWSGLQRRLYPSALLLVACWPPLLLLLSRWTTPFSLAWTESAGLWLVRILPVTVAVDVQPHVFHCSGTAGTQALTMADPCSGVGGLLALALVLVPVMHLGRGSWRRRLAVLVLATLLWALLTPLRFALLCTVAGVWGRDAVFVWFHHLGGSVSYLLLWSLLLIGVRLLRFHPAPPIPPVVDRTRPGRPSWWQALVLVLLLVLVGWADWRLMRRWVGLRRPTVVAVVLSGSTTGDLFPTLPGYDQDNHRPMDWTRDLFGPTSRCERQRYYRLADGTSWWVDQLVVDDFTALERHTVIDCYRWHDAEEHGRDLLELMPGLPARFLDVTDANGQRWRVVTWIQPVCVAGRDRWRRTVVRVRVGADTAERPALEAFARQLSGLAR